MNRFYRNLLTFTTSVALGIGCAHAQLTPLNELRGQQPLSNSLPVTAPGDVSASGTLTATNQAVTLTALNGVSDVVIELTGTGTATVVAEGSNDAFATVKTFTTTQGTGILASTNPLIPSGTASFYRIVDPVNYPSIRMRLATCAACSVSVVVRASTGNGPHAVFSLDPLNFSAAAYCLAATSAPTYTTGTMNALSCDLNGYGRVVLKASKTLGSATQVVQTEGYSSLGVPGNVATFTYYAPASGGYSPGSTPNDVLCIWGSPSKTVIVTAFSLYASSTTPTAQFVSFYLRSTSDSGGTPVPLTLIAADPIDAGAATATLDAYTAAPTSGTSAGLFWNAYGSTTTTAATTAGTTFTAFGGFSNPSNIFFQKPVVLRGTGSGLCADLNGETPPTLMVLGAAVQEVEFNAP
jgi:hypothetical protein